MLSGISIKCHQSKYSNKLYQVSELVCVNPARKKKITNANKKFQKIILYKLSYWMLLNYSTNV